RHLVVRERERTARREDLALGRLVAAALSLRVDDPDRAVVFDHRLEIGELLEVLLLVGGEEDEIEILPRRALGDLRAGAFDVGARVAVELADDRDLLRGVDAELLDERLRVLDLL